MGLLLDIGDEVLVSGPTAAALHRLDGFALQRPFHVVVPRGRNIQRIGVHVHTSLSLPSIDRATVDHFPVTSATRTLIDVAPLVSAKRLTAAVDAAVRDRLTTEAFLHQRLSALRGSGRSGSRRLLDVLAGAEIIRGGHSFLERRFLELLGEAGLPLPLMQQVLAKAGDRLVRVDCHYPDRRLVVELLGYRWHRTKEQMRRDAERSNELQLAGQSVFQFTYEQVVEEPQQVVDVMRRLLAA